MTYAIGLIDDKFDELLADYSWTLKGLRLTAEEVSEGWLNQIGRASCRERV